MLHLSLEVDFAEVLPGQLIPHRLHFKGARDIEQLSDLLAILSSEVEIARVKQSNLERSRGQFPVLRLPG